MIPSIDARLDILKAAMQEDRAELRLIKDKIYTVCTTITAFSFAVTAFLLDPARSSTTKIDRPFFLLIDVSFLMLLWMLFVRLKRDLKNAHKCLDAREDMIRSTHEEIDEPFDPFPNLERRGGPRIAENGLYWIVGAATVALVIKLGFVCTLASCHA